VPRNYFALGDTKVAAEEYERFRGCFAQLLDPESMVGDIEDRWVIFKDGWVYGMTSYPSKSDAQAFARQMFRDEAMPTYIILRVNADEHEIDGLHMLASALGQADDFDITTAPDEINRVVEDVE